MVIPTWLRTYLNDQDVQAIEQEIARIEKNTEAEIVPVIVRSSSGYAQAKVTSALIATLFFVVLGEILVPYFYWDYKLEAALFIATATAVIFVGAPLIARVLWVRRLLTLREEELEQCWKRARLEFFENRLGLTKDRVGVLIFVSLLEHVVIVLADQKIADQLPADTWKKVVDHIVTGVKNKSFVTGFLGGLKECSHLLGTHFPVKSGDKNELPNHLVMKE